MIISNSLKSFLNNLIDYAGLFPPAGLDLDSALANYRKYHKSEFDLALSRFILQVSRLSETSDILRNTDLTEKDLNFSILPTPGKNIKELKENIISDVIACKNFIAEFPDSIEINTFEIKLPDELFESYDSHKFYDLICYINEKLNSVTDKGTVVFFEGTLKSVWQKNSEYLIDSVYKNNLSNTPSGFKLRTGGLTPDAFPDSKQIAFCIKKCLDTKVAMKFTAGLHHPFRHSDKSIGAKMHGFVNVFGAGITAMRHDITDAGIVEMLDDEDPDNFKFTNDSFSWKGWQSEIDDIDFARKDLVLSYGSCSFDEPIDDLKSLNLIK